MRRIVLCFSILIICTIQANSKVVVLKGDEGSDNNTLSQDMFVEKGVEYHIIYGFDLSGRTIVLPENSTLSFFSNGSLSNGTLIGSNSSIKSTVRRDILNDIVIKGTWHVEEVYSTWFNFSEDDPVRNTSIFKSMCNLTDDNHYGIIIVDSGDYPISVDHDNENCLELNSNTDLVLNGNLLLEGNQLKKYSVICIEGKEYVNVCGKGTIVGDVNSHLGDEGEWGMGIKVMSSKYINIKGIKIRNCWGDCIYLGQTSRTPDSFSYKVLIDSVECNAGRRQGLSIIAGRDICVCNSLFLNTGLIKYTSPCSGIDIEPNSAGDTTLDNVSIENCVFRGNRNSDIKIYNTNINSSIYIKDCILERRIIFSKNSYNVDIDSCDIQSIIYNHGPFVNIVIRNSVIRDPKPRNSPSGVQYLNTEFRTVDKTTMSAFAVLIVMVAVFDYIKRRRFLLN